MVTLKGFYSELAKRLEAGEKLAVASIARRIGSAPRNQGARCAVLEGGAILGTIGGGLMEARTGEEGVSALADGKARYLKLRLDSKELAASGMICGGSVDILVTPWDAAQLPVAQGLLDLYEENGRGALVTTWDAELNPSTVALYLASGWIGTKTPTQAQLSAALQALATGLPVITGKEGETRTLAEPIEREKSPLIILGAGHVGRALTEVAAFAGFYVTTIDDREEFADPAKLPSAAHVLCRPFEGVLSDLNVDETTFIVICTRGHLSDTVCVLEALESRASYVGVIGSRRKKAMVVKRLLEAGIAEERMNEALKTPVGIEIGAETPEEIAVSIAAEMISLKRR